MNINDAIICPKCSKQFMKKSVTHSPPRDKEYFCHNCHEYFGLWELVNFWAYDAGDIFPEVKSESLFHQYKIEEWDADTVSDMYEPEWVTVWERKEAYRMVGRMHLGVQELDDYRDLLNTQNCALDIGVQ